MGAPTIDQVDAAKNLLAKEDDMTRAESDIDLLVVPKGEGRDAKRMPPHPDLDPVPASSVEPG